MKQRVVQSVQFTFISCPLKASTHLYVFINTHISVLNENKIITIRKMGTVSRVEILPAEHGLSC